MAAAEITRLLQPSILTEEEKAKCLIDMLGNNSKLTHSLQDKFFDKFTIEQIMGCAVLERVKGFLKILAVYDINKALDKWNEFEKCVTTPELVEAFINRFNAGLEKRIVESKLDLDTSRKDTLYKQTEAALREVLSAGPGPGGQASRSCLQSQRVQPARPAETEKDVSSKSSLGTGPDINDSVWEHYNEKAWKEWLEKKRYQERKNKLENNLGELEKLQQDVQEPSSKQTVMTVLNKQPSTRKEKQPSPNSSGCRKQSKELITSERSLNAPDSKDEKRAETRERIRKWRSKQKHEEEDVAQKITEAREKKKRQDEKIRTLHLKIVKHLSHDRSDNKTNSSKELEERTKALLLEINRHLSQSGSDHATKPTSQGSSGKRNIELGREQYSAKAWKAMLEKTRYQERKNKLENNLRELEKLQQDVQELSSKAQQWKQEWKMIKAEGLMKEQQEVMSQQVVLPSHQTSDQLDVNGGPSDTQGFFKGLDELRFDEQRHDAPKPM